MDAAEAWLESNRRHLTEAVVDVRHHLERFAKNRRAAASPVSPPAVRDLGDGTPPPALKTLCDSFGLTAFERGVLVLCAGMEFDSDLAAACAAAHDASHPTFGLALAALPGAHWTALAPAGPLRRWRLLEPTPGGMLTTAPLRIDERVLHHLLGVSYIDERLAGLVEPVVDPGDLPSSHRESAERLARVWTGPHETERSPIAEVIGRDVDERQAVTVTAASASGVGLFRLRAADVPVDAGEREALARLWEREAAFAEAGLLVEHGDAGGDEHGAAGRFAESVHGVVAVGAREPVALAGRRVVQVELRRPGVTERDQLWRRALGSGADALAPQLDAVIGQFDLGPGAIATASAELRGEPGAGPADAPRLWEACRRAARPRLDGLAQPIDALARWEDLVLPPRQLAVLHEIAAHVRRRTQVHDVWGFAAKSARGLGISALFSGASGTGKTMAAEVLANETRLDLYRIDLSSVVSKYIGETEKNLRRVFDAAEAGGAILLFDEADALFGRRSDVRDSHDRYANIEISYLLQRMEEYRGLAILTTNMRNALDAAFMRRLRFVVEFAFPDAEQRAAIWQRTFPAHTPVADLDFSVLARLDLTGGSIRNVALSAAFLAADAGEPVGMSHVARAVRAEFAKLDKPLSGAEMGAWR